MTKNRLSGVAHIQRKINSDDFEAVDRHGNRIDLKPGYNGLEITGAWIDEAEGVVPLSSEDDKA